MNHLLLSELSCAWCVRKALRVTSLYTCSDLPIRRHKQQTSPWWFMEGGHVGLTLARLTWCLVGQCLQFCGEIQRWTSGFVSRNISFRTRLVVELLKWFSMITCLFTARSYDPVTGRNKLEGKHATPLSPSVINPFDCPFSILCFFVRQKLSTIV